MDQLNQGSEGLVTKDECRKLAQAMASKNQVYLDGRTFKIKCDQQESMVTVTLTLSNESQSFVYPVEARIDSAKEGLSVRDASLFLIDYIDAYFEDFFADGEELYLPIDWADMTYDANNFQIKGQILNVKAEDLADELLKSGIPYDGPPQIL